jgi:4,5-dihydroxyphthalate decarboxylase
MSLTVACSLYDRTRPIASGEIPVEGFDIDYLPLQPEQVFLRAFQNAEFEVAELSLSTYTMLASRDQSDYMGLPIFVSRAFRHRSFYVPVDSDLHTLSALKGKRIGIPEYQQTAGVWMRSLLDEQYGVGVRDVDWFQGGVDTAGQVEKRALLLPPHIRVNPIDPSQTLSSLLLNGQIDAIAAAREPVGLGTSIRHLLIDPKGEERVYFRDTGIFPIMHILGIRKDVNERYPALAESLYRAFTKAKDLAILRLCEAAYHVTTLPFLASHVAEARAAFGNDFWPYDRAGNVATLNAFRRQCEKQGLWQKPLAINDMFPVWPQ